MVPIRKRAYARAGLAGNPSDGYFGKTLSIVVRNFWAEATLSESDELVLTPSREDQGRFASIDALVRDVRLHGYYGGLRLVKATVKRFAEYCRREGHALADRNFTLRYESNIPRQVGLAGSSAIVVAALRCLMEFHGVEIPRRFQPSLALAAEDEELAVPAGLQDRVIQVYEGLVYMDFARERMEERTAFVAGSTRRWTRACCRRCTWPTASRRASRPRSSTTTSAPVFNRASRRCWTRWCVWPTWRRKPARP